MKGIIISISAIVALSGCFPERPFYINEAKSVDDMQKDYGICANEAEKRYPFKMDSYETDPSFEPIVTSCTSYSGTNTYTTRCSSSGGYVPSKTEYYDANEASRLKHEQQCIEKKGYKLENIPWCSSEVPKGEFCWSNLEITGSNNVYEMQVYPVLTKSNGKLYSMTGRQSCLAQKTCSSLWE
jgi:hypothetical protein